MEPRFISAFCPPPTVRVFGRKLLPLTLRTRLLLVGTDNPIVQGLAGAGIEDLLDFVKIVSGTGWRPWDWFFKRYFAYSKFYRGQVESEIKAYKDYHMQLPKFWEQEKARKVDNCPALLSAVCWLIHNGFTVEEAWDTPEVQIFWYTAAFGIINGAETKFLTDEEEALLDSLIKIREQRK